MIGSSSSTPMAPGSSSVRARASFIDIHLATQEFFPVQVRNRRASLVLVRHFDEAEPSGLATVLVSDDSSRVDLSESFESGLEILFLHVK